MFLGMIAKPNCNCIGGERNSGTSELDGNSRKQTTHVFATSAYTGFIVRVYPLFGGKGHRQGKDEEEGDLHTASYSRLQVSTKLGQGRKPFFKSILGR